MASPEPTLRHTLRIGLLVSIAGVSVLSMLAPSEAAPPRARHAPQSFTNTFVPSGLAEVERVRRGPALALSQRGASSAARIAAETPPAAHAVTASPRHDPVAPARPTRMRFTGHGFDVTARVCAMANSMVLTPPGDPREQVCWVKPSMGEKPGSGTATSYVLGHSFANDPKTVMGPASRLASAQIAKAPTTMRSGVPTKNVDALDGATLTLWTAKGRLDYRVRDSFAVPKPQFGLVNRIEDDSIEHRVVLVTCAVHAGRDLDYNIIVEAFLTGSTRA